MDQLATLSGPLASWLALFIVVVARLSFVVVFMPGIGEQVIPIQMRLLVLLALSVTLASTGVVAVPSLYPLSGYAAVLASEVTIGFFLGALLRVSVWMLSIAGTIISQSIGLSQLLGVALEHEAQAMTANLLSMAGAAILLSADFHLNAVASLMRLYEDIPVGALASLDIEMIIQRSFSAVGFAVLLAWPFVAVNLLYNICLGFINKALPQLMVAFVGAPLLIGGGMILLGLSVTGVLMVWKDRVLQVVGWM
ncbi:flagellar biosynthetic protein FliR [Hyphomonas johnsonii]|uniref:Flagellar biosynthetic protein FliR n=1 Tax=Hyphomonas johnsonii MHS-2 TaxID=1280950 RepID=A0A059FNZ0_9PROT|nr:flagellar biosynthetic protein FliR [Hyphomonas johnsonii]KCZ92241.1 flagellar biosynthetic protein FliR [Hyphomonas johnsonii MHS-2]